MVALPLISEPSRSADCFDQLCVNIENESQWSFYIQKQSSLLTKILNIHSLREKRDLPNSMAQLTTENDFREQLYTEIESLRKVNRCSSHKILSCMFLQHHDESLSRTAIEISLRLSDKTICKWVNKLPKKARKNRLNLIKEIGENIQMNPLGANDQHDIVGQQRYAQIAVREIQASH